MHNGDHGYYDTLIQDQRYAFRKCIIKGPTSRLSLHLSVPSIEDSPAVPEQPTVEDSYGNMDSEKQSYILNQKRSGSFDILTGIGDENNNSMLICHVRTLKKMWEAIERA
ncbi:hypothetical protein Tco_0246429 [Tanacetum coccineum]